MSNKNVFSKIPSHLRTTFLTALGVGFFTHLYMLTNKLPNHDDISVLYGSGTTYASGRWLLDTVLGISGEFSTPLLNGGLALLWLAVAACFTVELLRIRRPLFCVLTAALMVSFPVVTSTLTYMFTADAYFLALAMAAAAVFCAVRFRWGWIPAVLLLALSMGIYQSYFAVAAVLCVGVLILECLDHKGTLKALLFRCLRLFFVLVGGLLLYLAITHISMQFVRLSDYMGINTIGNFPLAKLPSLIQSAYARYATFFVCDGAYTGPLWLRALFGICVLLAAILLVRGAAKRRLKTSRICLLAVLAALYPLAGNLVTLMAAGQTVHMLMLYGLCFLPIFLLVVLEAVQPHWPSAAWVRRICETVVAATLALQIFQYVVLANQAYLKMDVVQKQMVSYSTRLLYAVENTPGYELGMPLVLAGNPTAGLHGDTLEEFREISLTGVLSLEEYLNSYAYWGYLWRYHGYGGEVRSAESEVGKRFLELPEVAEMPAYPAAGSVRVIDGYVVVKFSR